MTPSGEPLGITLIIPTLNEEADLPRCLDGVRAQRFPADRLEVLVVDGGSTDATREIAASYGARVLDNPVRRAEPGYKLGLRSASHPIRVFFAADNVFASDDWLATVAGIFERSDVRGVYTQVETAADDNAFCRYFNRLHADPFNWFVFGASGSSPRLFGSRFPVLERGEGYVVYDLRHGDLPLVALVQGFALRGDLPEPPEEQREVYEEDDILPVWDLIERGERLAYTDVGVFHYTVTGFRDFLAKYRRRATQALLLEASPYRGRQHLLSRRQRRRRWLWIPYTLSLVAPLADALRGLARDRDPAWLYHPVACLALSATMASAVLAANRRGSGG